MQANIFWLRDPKNIGLHHKFLKISKTLPQTQVPTALTGEILKI